MSSSCDCSDGTYSSSSSLSLTGFCLRLLPGFFLGALFLVLGSSMILYSAGSIFSCSLLSFRDLFRLSGVLLFILWSAFCSCWVYRLVFREHYCSCAGSYPSDSSLSTVLFFYPLLADRACLTSSSPFSLSMLWSLFGLDLSLLVDL